MKNKILYSVMAFVMALFTVGCSDDNYTAPSTPMLTDGSVVTGTADVTPTSATLNGSVKGLEDQSGSSYQVGFYYGSDASNLSESVQGTSSAAFTATISSSENLTLKPGMTIYYQAYVTLQGRLTYKGDVQSLVLTDTKATTGEYNDLTAHSVKLSGSAEKYSETAKMGIAISAVYDDNPENVRNGVKYEGTTGAAYDIKALGLLPNTTYYYVAYVDLGAGQVYGEVKSFTTQTKFYDAEQDFVDLGLSTKWAKCNLGADSETDLGGLFGFGDMTGFMTTIDPEKYASADIYKTAQDVCYKVYEGKATMPTIDEIQELFDCCKVEWTEQNGVAGYKFTSKTNGNSIFMPAAGSRVESTTTGVGTEGRYLTGSVNETDTRYAKSFLFTQGGNSRVTTPVYQALSVRPVTVAKSIKLNKSLLYKTWEIDLTTDGSYKTFPGPSYFYGTDDCWRTVTNNEPCVGDSWCWAADFAGNAWAVGGSAKNCQGSITFNEDGTCVVKHITAEGVETDENGTYTIDEEKKEITLKDCKVLAPTNFKEGYTDDLSNNIRILSLTEKSLQLAVRRTDPSQGACLLSINMVPQLEKYGYNAKLTCYGPTSDGSDVDQWASATTTVAGGTTGTYTVTFNTTHPRTAGQVYVLDIEKFATAYPNAFVRIDKIEADGNEVLFDANKFYYGNIEGGGNFRVEMANIWGKGHNDGWNGLKDTPFHKGGGETTNETALAFNSTFAVTFTVVSLDADLSFTAKQSAVGLNEDWSMPGNWGKENPGAVKVKYNAETCQYELVSTDDVSLSMDVAADCGGVGPTNGAVNLVDVVGIRNYFPGFGCELKSVTNDGANVAFTASKLKYGDIEGNGNFRIELHNIWGSGTAADPAFGGATTVAGNNVVTSLGFSSKSVYTVGNFTDSKHLFAIPWDNLSAAIVLPRSW